MIILIIRILILLGIVGLVFFIVQRFSIPSEFIKCSRCEGKGFWYGARKRATGAKALANYREAINNPALLNPA